MKQILVITMAMFLSPLSRAQELTDTADLLIVGGTESGCAAAIQAARMDVRRVVVVNDIEWLGGQFSAEALGAIDENRAHGYDGNVPIPRSGLFREIIDAIESKNAVLYDGVTRPGNTRVITTARPFVAESVFRELLRPHEDCGQIKRYSNYRVRSVNKQGDRVTGVVFSSTTSPGQTLSVKAKLTIDASDWGDVIKASGAAYDFGIDPQAEFDEPSAPTADFPATDLNPITYCMIVVEQQQPSVIAAPANYDARKFLGTWNWIKEDFAYSTRRLVDGHGFEQIDHPDVLLINNPNIDYPLDVYSTTVANALEATEAGASKKNIVQMTAEQRQIVFDDAKHHSLQYLHYLQANFPKFRHMALSDEFGTPDRLPPKPYIREGLRLVAKHMIKEQEVLGAGSRANYARTMFPDAVFSWQFELDFHPTARTWVSDAGAAGPWEATFRGKRRFGNGGTGRAVFPLRSFVPQTVQGLLGAQKNLGYSSIVGSSCRLHDQSTAAGQACGAVAAVSLNRTIDPSEICFDSAALADVWRGLLEETKVPVAIWPFGDVDPTDAGFIAIQHLALRHLLPLQKSDCDFRPEESATAVWISEINANVSAMGYQPVVMTLQPQTTRRDIAIAVWAHVQPQPTPAATRISVTDADGDGLTNEADPLPSTPGTVSWKIGPADDGLPDVKPPLADGILAFNFTAANGPTEAGFVNDHGSQFTDVAGFGWQQDLSSNTRLRKVDASALRDGFVFTRQQDSWECVIKDGRYRVSVCLGDAAHDQFGQNVAIEGQPLGTEIDTQSGSFTELSTDIDVSDGRLTITLGTPAGKANTTINWVVIEPLPAKAEQ